MSPTTLAIAIIVILVCGLVAVGADWLGRRIGKKKLTYLGLRPKRIAQLFTFLSGVISGTLAILLIYALDPAARPWILEGPEYVVKLRAQTSGLQDQIQTLRGTEKLLEAERDAHLRENKDLWAKNKSLREKAAQDEAAIKKNDRLLQENTAKLGRNQAALARVNGQVKSLNDRRMTLEDQVRKGTTNLAEAKKDLDDVNGQLAEHNRQLRELNGENLRLEGENAKMESKNQDLTSQRNALQSQLDDLTNETTDKLQKASLALSQIRAQINDAKIELNILNNANDYNLTAPLIFARGEELARLEVTPLLSKGEATMLFDTALQQAKGVAISKGARPSRDSEVVALLPSVDPNSHQEASADELRQAIIARMTNAPNPQALLVRAVFNSYVGLWVPVAIDLAPNPVIYRDGQVLAEIRVNGRDNTQTLFNAITNFIGADLSNAVNKAGMIPHGLSQSGGVGEVGIPELFDLIQQIKAQGGGVRLQAVAGGVTRAAGPLKIRFRLR